MDGQTPFRSSGLWARSVGSYFPYIVYGYQKDADTPTQYGVQHPDGVMEPVGACAQAIDRAVQLKAISEGLPVPQHRPAPCPIRAAGPLADKARGWLAEEASADPGEVAEEFRFLCGIHQRSPLTPEKISRLAIYVVEQDQKTTFFALLKFARLHHLIEA